MSRPSGRTSLRTGLKAAVIAAAVLALPATVHALAGLPKRPKTDEPPPGYNWEAFTRLDFVLEVLLGLLTAAALGAALGYHPRTYGRAISPEDIDQPKIFIMYAVVGSAVAEVVRAFPEMAFVIFGIGGLLRFRTDVGHARDTGRVILATIVGLACGLKIYVVAVLAAAFGWILILLLEAHVMYRLTVKGIGQTVLAKAAEAYEEALRAHGLRITSEKKNFLKSQVAFVFRAPGNLDRDRIEEFLKEVPESLRGTIDWESN